MKKAHKLSISNIGWGKSQDSIVYGLMQKYDYCGLEIAPTRIFPEIPYSKLEKATLWANDLLKIGFKVSSMQSIWYGRQEKMFGSKEERQFLVDYTKQAINFANAIGCGNLVFGNPRNRNLPSDDDGSNAVGFFRELGEYAQQRGTCIGLEANPPIYNTNFINDTATALTLIKEVDLAGFKLNLDIGTMIHNEEPVSNLRGKVSLINHVHISEPMLKSVKKRELHEELAEILSEEDYDGYISIEMGNQEDLAAIEFAMKYVKEIFG